MVGLSRTHARPLPARVLRRAEAAHRHRPRAGAAAAPADPRRAGRGARRLDPGADHQPAAGPAARARPRLPVHRPRPLGGPPHLGPRRGDVSRPHRRGERARRRSTTTPTHPYTQSLLSAVPVPDPARARTPAAHRAQGEIPNPAAPPPGCTFHPRCFRADARCARRGAGLRALSRPADARRLPLRRPARRAARDRRRRRGCALERRRDGARRIARPRRARCWRARGALLERRCSSARSLLAALFARRSAARPARAGSRRARSRAPSAAHWFGTDELGRDILARVDLRRAHLAAHRRRRGGASRPRSACRSASSPASSAAGATRC